MQQNKLKLFLIIVLTLTGILLQPQLYASNNNENEGKVHQITVKDIKGNDVKLSDYKGKVLLIVNVASYCGYTRQYEGLQKIYDTYKNKGFEILAFPCNDFGQQEPGTNAEIEEFCDLNFGITFKLFDKIRVLGEDKSPLYKTLINNEGTEKGDIKWNFEKFLISKNGGIVKRFRSNVEPESEEMIKAIEAELSK